VIGYEHAVSWLTEHFEGVAPDYRQDVARTTSELCRHAPPHRRCLELLSLVGLALRLRSRAGTADRPDAVWRQGVHLGALLLLTALAAQSAARPAGIGGLGLAVALIASVGSALLGRRSVAVALAASGAIVNVLWVAHGADAGAFVSSCVVGIGGLIAGSTTPVRDAGRLTLGATGIVLASLLSAAAIGTGPAQVVTLVAFAWVAPIVLVVSGWFDPRLAAAATTLVFGRLAASAFGELGRALAVLQQDGHRQLLARWVLMGTGVLGTWLATERSIQRATRL
jgi:hypothetical protein